MHRAEKWTLASRPPSFLHARFSIQLHQWRWPYTKMTLPTGCIGEKVLKILFLVTMGSLLFSYGFSFFSFILGCFSCNTRFRNLGFLHFVGRESTAYKEGFQKGSRLRYRTMGEWSRTPCLERQSRYFIIPFKGNCAAGVCAKCYGPTFGFSTHWSRGTFVLVWFFFLSYLYLHWIF